VRIVVVGAGFGGLAAAIRLRQRGHDVTVVEKRHQAGGRAGVLKQDGFTFDMGPTILTAPHLIQELFHLAGRQMEDFIRLVPVDPFYRVRFEDGSQVDWGSSEAARLETIRRLSPDDVPGYRRFAATPRDIIEDAFPLIDQPFDSLGPMARALPALVRAKAWQSVAALVASEVRDERTRQLLSFHPLLIGGNPFDTPSIYALIHELERRWGVWFAEGGTGALIEALVRLLRDMGGAIRLDAEVTAIEVDGDRATAVRLVSGERMAADAIVFNGDVVRAYRDLVPASARRTNSDRRIARYRQGMSLFVMYFGTSRRYDHVAHHEILLGPRFQGLLDDVFNRRRLAEDFSLYLHRPTATDPSLAPPGCDAWYVLSPVPNLGSGIDWASAARPYRDRIVRHLEARVLPDLSQHIVTEACVDPRYFRDELNAELGSAFSFQPLLRQSAWFRGHVQSEDIPNLYFVGAGTHPGAGIPGVLSSARIVDRLLEGQTPSSAVRETSPSR
jgi:phytoene desaturase